MILCHKYKFIFIKTAKTAGTSIEIALSKFCGDDDIITPLAPADEAIRQRLGYRGPQNYLAPKSEYRLGDVVKLLTKGAKKCRFYNHMPAREVKERTDPQVWDSYFKFCFERNPWDRMISYYYHRYRSGALPPFSEYVRSDVPLLLKRKGVDLYQIGGEVVVDRVCRYEDLPDEIQSVREHLNLPEPLELPRAKGGHRKDKRPYKEVIKPAECEKISDLFREEIAMFGYSF